MKKVLGLDLGPNSIGWSVVNKEEDENEGRERLTGIEATGCRIIPMDAATLGDFGKGNSVSQTKETTRLRGIRRLGERFLLRRERLHRVLALLDFLPAHYANSLDRYGHFLKGTEPKLEWYKNEAGKWEFLFHETFDEMLADFKRFSSAFVENPKKIPYDWTIYYLRKKALTEKISKEELAWILLNFNQKRGYYQRDEEEDTDNDITVERLKVVSVTKDEKEKKGGYWYNVLLENGITYRAAFANDISCWEGSEKEFLVKRFEKKDKAPQLSVLPSFEDIDKMSDAQKNRMYAKIKLKTEKTIADSGKTVGSYIYDALLQNPCQKIRGKLVRTIDRKFYKEELLRILEKQCEFHAELQDPDLYKACIEELYPQNGAHRDSIVKRGFVYLFIEDILFYQRPLKSKKSLIADCPYESVCCEDKKTGEKKHYPIKCIAKSNPLFQEFRLWQFIINLRIYKKEESQDRDVTNELIKTEEDYVALFDWLNEKESIKQDDLLKFSHFGLKKKEIGSYRWNYVEDKNYPCNETRSKIVNRLKKCDGIPEDFPTQEDEMVLWHILYSVSDKLELEKALNSFASKHGLNSTFVDNFKKFPPFKKEYGAYSAKAIRKLLSLMRLGRYWNETDIDPATRLRIDKIVSGEYDETIRARVREKAIHLSDISDFKGLPVWLACYVVYDRHSEVKDITKWNSPDDIDVYLKAFKQHSLRNPIVEQVVLETLRTVRDIWKKVGRIDEIHVELGREMKAPADKRAQMTAQIAENEAANMRIKYLLTEFLNPDLEIENVRPYSPSQQEILRIYEDGALNSEAEKPTEIEVILKKLNERDVQKRPTESEIKKYKLWLEQHYRSPYTGVLIPLAKLFTSAYQIEHVIPQSRYFDDSLSNKVICEAEVNSLKGNMLGHEFIEAHHGEKVSVSDGKTVTILSVEAYEIQVKETYGRNRGKMKKLMMNDIPDDFIARQLNDSRYISKLVKSLLSNIVREEGEQEAISKNVVPCTGGITDRLKKDWGVNDIWNAIILPRFRRMNELTERTDFTTINQQGHEIPAMPLELQMGFNKKRIDHRHHAMDAIVIACADRNICNYLNNESARSGSAISRHDLQRLLCDKVKTDDNGKYKWLLKKPWDTFTQDTKSVLEQILVSFKQNSRIINKSGNRYWRYVDGKKRLVEQEKGERWAIRKSLHKDTVFGEVNLRRVKTVSLNAAIKNPQAIVDKELKMEILSLLNVGYDVKKIKKYFDEHCDVWQDVNLSKIEVYYFTQDANERFFATRKSLDVGFDKKKIENITDTGIQKILLRHLAEKGDDPKIAFSPEGIEEMNRNIVRLNNGKSHQPILKVRVSEKADKFEVGQSGNKRSKFVEADKGTNLFFAVYESKSVDERTGAVERNRSFVTIPLKEAIERIKAGLPVAKEDENGKSLIFVLSPNDLVYLPTKEELEKGEIGIPIDKSRIYKLVDSSDTTANFVPYIIANVIYSLKKDVAKDFCKGEDLIQNELGLGSPQSKNQRAWTSDCEMIKEICVPVKVDRLGQIVEIGKLSR